VASSDSSPSTSSASAPNGSGPYEKWLVRILLALAFGLAFGIEGMTLVRSFLIDTEPSTEQAADAPPVLSAGDALVPAVDSTLRARRLQLRATREAWTFVVTARPDTARSRPVTLTFDRLTLSNGSARTTAPSRTWPPGDTASFTASWSLPVGQRPDALTVTVRPALADSSAAATRTVDVGHVPVRMQ
jgi:hypothetical protein